MVKQGVCLGLVAEEVAVDKDVVMKLSLDAVVEATEFIKKKLLYHSAVDHGFMMPEEMAHNLAAHVAMGQVEALRDLFRERGAN